MRFLPDSREPRVAIVGFGYVGCCLGVTLAEQGLHVTGIDRDARLIAQLEEGRCHISEPGLAEALTRLRGTSRLTFSTGYDAIESADVIVIAVGTPIGEDRSLVTRQLEEVCAELAPRLRRGHLVVLKSTVAPGTTRGLVRPRLETGGLVQGDDFGLVFCPERLSEGNALSELRALPIIVGGCDTESTHSATEFWKRALDVPAWEYTSPEVAEIVKLADNWWIDHNIALANDLARLCDAFHVDVLEVIGGANSLPKGGGHVNILLPSVGVGGYCLTKDPWITWNAAREHGVRLRTVETVRAVNDAMPGYTHETICAELARAGRHPDGAKVAVLGAAFKNNTGDLRSTPVKPVVDGLLAAGVTVSLHDPLADAEELRALTGVEPSASLEEAVAGAHCVAVLAGHEPFQQLDFAALRERVSTPCLIFDGRAYYPQETIEHVRRLGFTYRGIGR
ncbi:nucleotide sugar dehydrogenase [Nonomuraea sp. KC401]|uniref:nucleotide sugar dehydrogenase n=1 Tax=unclassified Nonomuraea TaxID=2593643 RepID=UPI0010FDCE4E|nr:MULTISPECIES: nucleotide sugar dehydrogenase [unclassified Nonomuraea]NBE93719.1 nucleotide sugar dehydrogenase [Nonomuraea sp. K271]TLF76983.1 nucleotide sugar dehydrogenase [Nonomuraea sp. KC401]